MLDRIPRVEAYHALVAGDSLLRCANIDESISQKLMGGCAIRLEGDYAAVARDRFVAAAIAFAERERD
jgi:hypothetical protein